ncbi:MAG: gamma-glutamyl-gamma-aminobutyrate hydrolase family protein [Draconibacterium sp.]|nr:gamma-glutamyl-gamma-aminobutyrate hydrolase family protein [Draconibacterium sp.]
MKKIILFFFVIFSFQTFAQNFFTENFNKRKEYIILTNPTVQNLKTIQYLLHAHLLDINTHKAKFVGVFYSGQKYDFNETHKYIENNDLKNFFLQEVSGHLNKNNLFEENDCSSLLKTIFENSIGIFFFGGPDIPPGIYREKNTLSVVSDPGRHYFETTFLFHLLGSSRNNSYQPLLKEKPNYLVTGFCLGMQTMNVATGGTLIQDIPSEIYNAKTPEETIKLGRKNLHRNYWHKISDDTLLMTCNLHTIKFTDHPFFGTVIKMPKQWSPRVYSSHHQAIENLGKGLIVTALSSDGKIIEGVVHKQFRNVFAVQFHPEVSALYEDMYVRKFHPDDKPMTYHNIIGKQSVKFHEKYWSHISDVLRKN